MYSLCNNNYIQQSSGVLVVFSCAITVSKLANPEIVVDIAYGLKGIWVFAEIFLFTLTGTSLSFNSSNGPLYGERGLSGSLMSNVVSILFAGTASRLVALGICVMIMYPFLPPHRKKLSWAVPFWITAYIFQIPKATVQATLGSVAYTQKIIPGPAGFNQGLIIAQSTAFAVLIFAPLGSLLTTFVGSPISLYLRKMDKDAGWDEMNNTYLVKQPSHKEIEAGVSGDGIEMIPTPDGKDSDPEEEEEEVVKDSHGIEIHAPADIFSDTSHFIKRRLAMEGTPQEMYHQMGLRSRKNSEASGDSISNFFRSRKDSEASMGSNSSPTRQQSKDNGAEEDSCVSTYKPGVVQENTEAQSVVTAEGATGGKDNNI